MEGRLKLFQAAVSSTAVQHETGWRLSPLHPFKRVISSWSHQA
jgi:hypothetical protein